MYIYISRETERVKYILPTIALQNLDVDGINVTLLKINENSVHPVVFVMIWDSLLYP